MATQGEFLINQTVEDCAALLAHLEGSQAVVNRIIERIAGVGTDVLDGYTWPPCYSKADAVALYQSLVSLPGLIVEDSVRDELYKIVSCIQ